ncbi:MAG: hypothetical protein OQK24_04925 [Magnetovibrio sp.]|nr:hypothetical protein [Magnetovibrio sp.]
MSDAVEIYICLEGQALKEGKMEMSNSIYDKHAAEDDALARVKRNPKIAKVAYYRINESGDFRIFYSYTNKDLASSKAEEQKPKPKRKKPRKKGFFEKWLGIGGPKTKVKKTKPQKAQAKKKATKKKI